MKMSRVTALFLPILLAAGCSPSGGPADVETSPEQPPAISAASPADDGTPPERTENDMIFERPLSFTNRNPFPTAGEYAVFPMLPSNKSEDERNTMIVGLFREILLNNLIVDSGGPQDRDGFRMVLEHTGWGDGHITVSESQGYGMMMMVYMAGCEDELALPADGWRNGSECLKDYYDAMLRTVLAFPSITGSSGNSLFTWQLFGNTVDAGGLGSVGEGTDKTAHFTLDGRRGTSATDGDMDIIYSLLLADRQWGGGTKFNGRDYKQIALDMLADLWYYCVHDTYHTLRLGDWAKGSPNAVLRDATRPSDFITGHLKAYREADPAHDWQKVIDATYTVISDIREAEAGLERDNGLLPDFVVRGADGWEVPDGNVLEGDHDKSYYYNSCRVPWRLGADYLLYGDTEIGAKSLYTYCIEPLDRLSRGFAGGTAGGLGPARMDGGSVGWADPAVFAAPFLVTAAAVKADQDWVNAFYDGWEEWRDVGAGGASDWKAFQSGLDDHANDYYGDYIKMLSMLTANGYWWLPAD